VEFEGDRLLVSQGARLGRDLRASVGEKENIQIAAGTVLGEVDISLPETGRARHILGFQPWHFWFKVLWAFSLLASGLVLVFLFPRQSAGVGAAIINEPGKSLIWGFVGLIVMPVASILLAITVIGIPLGVVLLAICFVMAYLSQLSLGLALAHRLYGTEGRRSWALFWPFAAGLLIVQALTFFPYLGIVVVLAGLVVGFGAILLVARSEFRKGTTP
jgi:hypothetical protein